MTEMGRTSNTYGAILKCAQNFSGKPEGKRLEVDGRIILNWI